VGHAFRETLGDGVAAGAVAAVVSGAPSSVTCLVSGRSMLEAVRAAGSLVGSPTIAAGAAVHAAVSLVWGVVLAAALPRRKLVVWGAVAGGAIAVVDLLIVGRRVPRIRALPLLPQVADHVAYGAVVGAVLSSRRSLSGCRSR